MVPFNSTHTKTKHSNVNNATITKKRSHVATTAKDNDHDNTKISPTDVEIVDAQTAATLPTRGKYVDKKRCSSSLQNGLCSDFAPAPGCGLMRSALLAHISFVKFCHGAAPSSLLQRNDNFSRPRSPDKSTAAEAVPEKPLKLQGFS